MLLMTFYALLGPDVALVPLRANANSIISSGNTINHITTNTINHHTTTTTTTTNDNDNDNNVNNTHIRGAVVVRSLHLVRSDDVLTFDT